MFDDADVKLNDTTKYPGSSFVGAKVLEFATSDTATKDTVLGIKVKYNTINNVGDIVFESDHTSGTFTYKSGTKHTRFRATAKRYACRIFPSTRMGFI